MAVPDELALSSMNDKTDLQAIIISIQKLDQHVTMASQWLALMGQQALFEMVFQKITIEIIFKLTNHFLAIVTVGANGVRIGLPNPEPRPIYTS